MIQSPIRLSLKPLPATFMIAALFLAAVLLQGGTASSVTIEVLYAPNDAPLDRLVALYQQARHYIYVSVYGLTSPRAVKALVAAKKRGVEVRMGSMNHTTSGNAYNDERMDIIIDRAISLKVREHFMAMWNDHTRFTEWK